MTAPIATIVKALEKRVRALALRIDIAPVYKPEESCKPCLECLNAQVAEGYLAVLLPSENTVYGNAQDNFLFRVHHDLIHHRHQDDFTFDGELGAAIHGANDLGLSGMARLIYLIDTAGQAVYFEKSEGLFLDNQVSFVRAILGQLAITGVSVEAPDDELLDAIQNAVISYILEN